MPALRHMAQCLSLARWPIGSFIVLHYILLSVALAAVNCWDFNVAVLTVVSHKKKLVFVAEIKVFLQICMLIGYFVS